MDRFDETLARAAEQEPEFEEMCANYEAMDQAEYAELMAELDERDAQEG